MDSLSRMKLRMNKPRFSLSTLMLAVLLLLFMALYAHQRWENQQALNRIGKATLPLRSEIASTRTSIQNLQNQIDIANRNFSINNAQKRMLKTQTESKLRSTAKLRSHHANVRNSKLKINRDREKLKVLENELNKMLDLTP